MLKKFLPSSIMTLFILPFVLTSSEDISEFDSFDFETELANQVGRLVKTCFTNTNRLITLSGTVGQNLAKKIHESESTSVTRMSMGSPSLDEVYTNAKQSMKMYHTGHYYRLEHKAQGFVLSAASQPILHQQVRDLRDSRWWNAGGLFIIVDPATAIDESCKNAESFLWLAWHYGMLSSVFLCHDASDRVTIYSYSPYNDMAPKNWLRVGQRLGRRGHPWILLKRYASESLENCNETFYDKTKTLNDYKIRTNAVALPPRLYIDYNKTGLERYTGEEGKLTQCIFNFLNASAEDVPYDGDDHVGFFDANGTYSGMLADVFTGRVDLGLNGRYLIHMWKLILSHFFASADICFVVKSRGYVPQWMNLVTLFDVWVNLGVIIVTLFSTAVLVYHSGVSAGCMNGLRLIISVTLVRPPSQVLVRLLLTGEFSLLLIITGLFQGRLVSLLTKPRAYENPETISDLVDGGYKVVGYTPFMTLIDDPVLLSRYEKTGSIDHIERLLSDEKITGIFDCRANLFTSKNQAELHVLRQRLKTVYLVFAATLDWPLLGRFNQVIDRLIESGFPSFWQSQDTLTPPQHRRTDFAGRNNPPTLSLSDLAFIFNWLLFGLTFATLVFIFEIIIR